MADISKIKTINGTTYDIKDNYAMVYPYLRTIETKTYTDVIATGYTQAESGFFYAKVRGATYDTKWHVKVRVRATVPSGTNATYYNTDTLFDLWGFENRCCAWSAINSIANTVYTPISHNCFFRVSYTGYNNNCGGWLGFSLQSSTSSTNTSLKRTIIVDLLEYSNCTVEMQSSLITPQNIPERTSHTDWYSSTYNSFEIFNAYTNGIKSSGDEDTTSISNLYHKNGSYVADSQIWGYQLLFQIDENTLTPLNNENLVASTNKTMLTDVEFNIFGNIYYLNSTNGVAEGVSVGANLIHYSFSDIDLRYTLNCGNTLTSNKPIYLVVTPTSNNKCKIASVTPWSQTLPSSNDGKLYILIGRTTSTYGMVSLYPMHPVYMYDGTTVKQILPNSYEFDGKADKTDTILETTLSRGRKENTTVGTGSFAFGYNVTASGNYSHGESSNTTASGNYSHAEGYNTTASGYGSHSEGTSTRASGSYAHTQGNSTIAQRKSQHAGGEYNVADTEGTTGTRGTFAEIIGNGSADNARSNARALDWDGNEYLKGNLYLNCNEDSSGGVPAVKYIQLLTSDNTWEKVWDKINILAVNESAFIYVPGGGSTLPLAILTDGTFESYYHYGIVSKTGEGNFRFSLTSTIQNLLRFSLTGASSSSIGTFTYLRSDYELDAKADKIVLTAEDDTWAKVWAKISILSSGDSATLYANGTAWGVISSGARSSQCMGIITRSNNDVFQFMVRFTNVYGLYASITNVSSSSPGTYAEGLLCTTYNDLDRTTSGYALDARMGKALNDKIMPDTQIYQSSSTSHTFTVPTNSRNLFIMGGDGVTYAYIAYIYGSSNGTVTWNEIYKGSKIGTVTVATNKITIPLTTASSVYCRSINVRGNPIS